MSEVDELLIKLPKDFKIDFSKIGEIRSVEEKYNKLGKERLERLDSLAITKTPSRDAEWFILGYSECGQDLESQLARKDKVIEMFVEHINDINNGDEPTEWKKKLLKRAREVLSEQN